MGSAGVGLLVCLMTLERAGAVIVGGTLGTGNNNTDEAGLQGYLSSASYPSFDYYGNLVRVSDASGVYLGYNPETMTGWVLSAAHITPAPADITVGGTTYTVTGPGVQIGGTDLILYEIGGPGDPPMPTLPTVPLATVAATSGEFLVMAGRGGTSSSTYPYPWQGPGFSEAAPQRWGTNRVEFNAMVGGNPYIVTDFDEAASPEATAYEGQAALGDSGGGLFILRDGMWVLAGIAHFVDDGNGFLTAPSEGTNPTEYGDFSAYSDIAANVAAIQAITGTLVPEPSAVVLSAVAGVGLTWRRRRPQVAVEEG